MTRAAIYARYSDDKQNAASIDDQLLVCRELGQKNGWQLAGSYTDPAISGAFILNRPGIKELLRDAQMGKFDVVLGEALDRFSRDQEDIAAVFKRLKFQGIKMVTLAEGEITELHVGLKGTMNALFLKDLSAKTHRGLRGRVEQGKSGGGITYGYDIVKRIDPHTGDYVRGERAINVAQAGIVQRIFKDYIAGTSPRSIAVTLNKEGIPGPQGGEWGASTIYGNRERGTGILNNELYIGKLVWNRLRYVKDPDTGKRVSRLNAPDELIVKDVPELRILDNDLWDAAKRLQGEINRKDVPLWTMNRPKSLFSHLCKCGSCGGGFSMVSAKHLGCSTARNKGTCDNRMTIERERLEQMVLLSLRNHLMDEHLCAEFCKEYTHRMNELRIEHNSSLAGYRAEMVKLERETQQIIRSIQEGVSGALLKDRSIIVQSRKEELQTLLANVKEEPVLFHPNMANRYHQEIRHLLGALNTDESRAEATTILRSLIDRIIMTPTETGDRLTVDLIGDLAGILSIASKRDRKAVEADLSKLQPVQQTDDFHAPAKNTKTAKAGGFGSSLAMVAGGRVRHDFASSRDGSEALVAGAGFEPAAFRL